MVFRFGVNNWGKKVFKIIKRIISRFLKNLDMMRFIVGICISFSTKIMFLNNLYLSSLYNPPQSVFAISFNAMTIPLLHFF
ncbi:Uncharacterised protein [Streptococcus pneumoniae]|nr:Uncharacterised protein [Streptococcus pneumoniae]